MEPPDGQEHDSSVAVEGRESVSSSSSEECNVGLSDIVPILNTLFVSSFYLSIDFEVAVLATAARSCLLLIFEKRYGNATRSD